MITWVVGAGSWGMRVAAKLDAMPGVVLGGMVDSDREKHHGRALTPQGRWVSESLADVLYAATGGVSSMGVVVAVPPCEQKRVVLQALRGGVKHVRVEKPCGLSSADACEVRDAAAEAGAVVSVGFTLVALDAYQFVCRLLAEADVDVLGVSGLRLSSAKPAHSVDAVLDLGVHTASIAALFDAPLVELVTGFDCGTSSRTTRIVTTKGDIVVDEFAQDQRVTLPNGNEVWFNGDDPLQRELRAFVDGVPLCGVELAIEAHGRLEDIPGGAIDVTPRMGEVAA